MGNVALWKGGSFEEVEFILNVIIYSWTDSESKKLALLTFHRSQSLIKGQLIFRDVDLAV